MLLNEEVTMTKNKRVVMSRRLSQEEFIKRLDEKEIKIKPLDPYVRMYDTMRWQCDKYDDHIWITRPADIFHGSGCPYCSHNKVLVGFNDLWTVRPDVASLLVDKDIGYTLFEFSNSKHDFRCPHCNTIIENKSIDKVSMYGLRCPVCSDGVSYPEKIVSNMLEQLKVQYCHNSAFQWSNNKRYDFYIESSSLIIECHGEQHYSNKTKWKNDVDKQIDNDKYKMNMAFENGINHYIQLDCRKSDCEYIKQSILSSELNSIFNLSAIDWEKCNLNSLSSKVVEAANLWNSGIRNATEISKILGVHHDTVVSHLKRMTKHGLCDYDAKEQKRLSIERNRNFRKCYTQNITI